MSQNAIRTNGHTENFVLVHGGFHGGWCWRRVADRLVTQGHRVYTPTQTGLGERSHLFDSNVDLTVFVDDIVGVIEAEELQDVILVGHSLGGLCITGVADRIPHHIRHLVYLDALIVEHGGSAFDAFPPELVSKRIQEAERFNGGLSVPPLPASAFGITDPDDAAWVERRLSPQPLRIYQDKIVLQNPVGNDRPRTYVACTNPPYAPQQPTRDWVMSQDGWGKREVDSGHDAMIAAPDRVTDILLEIASESRY